MSSPANCVRCGGDRNVDREGWCTSCFMRLIDELLTTIRTYRERPEALPPPPLLDTGTIFCDGQLDLDFPRVP